MLGTGTSLKAAEGEGLADSSLWEALRDPRKSCREARIGGEPAGPKSRREVTANPVCELDRADPNSNKPTGLRKQRNDIYTKSC